MSTYDLAVVGAGPGGYVAAIRAAQLGMRVVCIDDNDAPGGTCLRVGCIPSKALLESSEKFAEASSRKGLAAHGIVLGDVELDLDKLMKRKDRVVKGLTGGVKLLLGKNKVDHVVGRGRLESAGRVEVEHEGETSTVEAERIVLATGTVPATLPGVELGGRIGTSTEGLAYGDVPEHLVVIGAGYIGLEMGSVWSRLGAKVTVLEYLDRILPGADGEIASLALETFGKQGLGFELGTRVTGAEDTGDRCVVRAEGRDDLECDRVLVAVGRKPATSGLGLEELGVETDQRGYVQVDGDYQTSAPGVFAIGDLIGGLQLAHKAEEEGIACVEKMATGYGHVNYDAIPGVVYTQPEIATVGQTEEQLQEAGVAYGKGSFPFRGNGRARAVGHDEGLVKILVDAGTDRILGVHILGHHAGDLIAEAVAAMEFGRLRGRRRAHFTRASDARGGDQGGRAGGRRPRDSHLAARGESPVRLSLRAVGPAVVRGARRRCGAIVESRRVPQMGPRRANPAGVGVWAPCRRPTSSTMPPHRLLA